MPELSPEPIVFSDARGLREQSPGGSAVAIQAAAAGGMWFNDTAGGGAEAVDNGGTVVVAADGSVWRRAVDPARIDARWFGVVADGRHDDAPGLQAAIDALPAGGGKVLLPGGRMRCSTSLTINRPFVTVEGLNCGLVSKLFEPGSPIGKGSLLLFDQATDGVRIESAPQHENQPRLGGITLRELGIAGTGRDNGKIAVSAKPGEGRGEFGSTDALHLDRVYVIEYEWAVELRGTDVTLMSGCWFCENGNGVAIYDSVFTQMQSCVVADNSHTGVYLQGCRAPELLSTVFVRNESMVVGRDTSKLRIIGGTCENDENGGLRDYKAFIDLNNVTQSLINATTFDLGKVRSMTPYAIEVSGDAQDLLVSDCRFEGIEPMAKGR